MMNWPLVSIVTINYDHPEVTCEMLASLKKITYPAVEIIVVDNASPNDDPDIIPESFPDIIFIKMERNLGFAGGNNIGIRHAKGDYVMLLNNDIEVDPGFLEPLVRKLMSDRSIGAVSPKIKFFYQPEKFQYAGYSEMNTLTMRGRSVGYRSTDEGQYDKDRITAYVHGAAMLVPMRVIRKVGLMAESYFLYYEELDWGLRIRKAGYQLWYIHDSVVYHKESVSTGKMSPQKTYYLNRARILYMRRNIHGVKFLIAMLFMTFISVPKNILNYFFAAQPDQLKAYTSAIFWHLKNIYVKTIHSNPTLDQ